VTLDPTISELIYQVGDTASDPAAAAEQLRGVLAQLEGQGAPPTGQQPAPATQHLAAGFGPGGSTALAPGVTPYPELEPFPIDKFAERVDQVGHQVATMSDQDRQATLDTFVNQLNRSLDEAARQEAPHHYPPPPASTDEELAALAGRVHQAALDPGALAPGDLYGLVEELNGTITGIGRDHERRVEEWEQRRALAERQRHAKARQEDTAARDLRALAGRLDGTGR